MRLRSLLAGFLGLLSIFAGAVTFRFFLFPDPDYIWIPAISVPVCIVSGIYAGRILKKLEAKAESRREDIDLLLEDLRKREREVLEWKERDTTNQKVNQ